VRDEVKGLLGGRRAAAEAKPVEKPALPASGPK